VADLVSLVVKLEWEHENVSGRDEACGNAC